MAIRVLIVDDSTFFRKRLTEIIKGDPALEICGEAKDGREGVEMTARLRPDVVTMDVEMPVMDGITAVKEIMQKCPTPILMFSSLTFEGANSTFKALEAGAVDFMPKNFDDIAHRREDALNELRANIKAVARSRVRRNASLAAARPAAVSAGRLGGAAQRPVPSRPAASLAGSRTAGSVRPSLSSATRAGTVSASSRITAVSPGARAMGSASRMAYEKIQDQLGAVDRGRPAAAMQFTFGNHKSETTVFRRSGKTHEIVAIGSSTGGPIAIQNILPKIPRLNVPMVIVQHMPPSFTATFAQRLNAMSQMTVVEAKDGDVMEPGTCYVAPGGMQMIFERGAGKSRIRILKGDDRVVYHPCVDVSFASLASIYGGRVLAMILTGMGSDGCEGCRLLKRAGSVIWAQNEDTCVVYGMPQAVVNAGLADQVVPLDRIAEYIKEEM